MNAEEPTDSAVTVAPPPARGLRTGDAADYIGFSQAFLRKARCGKTEISGPKFKKIGSRVVYLREDLDAFLEQSEQDENLDQSERAA